MNLVYSIVYITTNFYDPTNTRRGLRSKLYSAMNESTSVGQLTQNSYTHQITFHFYFQQYFIHLISYPRGVQICFAQNVKCTQEVANWNYFHFQQWINEDAQAHLHCQR